MSQPARLWERCVALRAYVEHADAWRAVVDSVEREYDDASRVYHGLHHIHRMFDELERWRPDLHLDLQRLACLELAILFHDVVYVPGRSDNEARSAERSRRDLRALGAPRAIYHQVERSVRATIHHVCDRRDVVSCLLIDLDLCAMANESEYIENGDRIRREFSVTPDDVFIPARVAFLRGFLARRKMFRGPFADRYEGPTRENMTADLHRIEAGR